MFNSKFCRQIIEAAEQSNSKVMRIQTVKEMKVFDLMTGGDDSGDYINQMNSSGDDVDYPMRKKTTRQEKIDAVKEKLEEYGGSIVRIPCKRNSARKPFLIVGHRRSTQ